MDIICRQYAVINLFVIYSKAANVKKKIGALQRSPVGHHMTAQRNQTKSPIETVKLSIKKIKQHFDPGKDKADIS